MVVSICNLISAKTTLQRHRTLLDAYVVSGIYKDSLGIYSTTIIALTNLYALRQEDVTKPNITCEKSCDVIYLRIRKHPFGPMGIPWNDYHQKYIDRELIHRMQNRGVIVVSYLRLIQYHVCWLTCIGMKSLLTLTQPIQTFWIFCKWLFLLGHTFQSVSSMRCHSMSNACGCVLPAIHATSVKRSKISLTHWGLDKMAVISQTTFSNAISSTKMSKSR